MSVAIRIMCCKKYSKLYLAYADDLCKCFVQQFCQIYGEKYMSQNVHELIHLSDDVSKFGVLDNFSSFPFENSMRRIKELIRKPDKPLAQIVKRYGEIHSSDISVERLNAPKNQPEIDTKTLHHNGPNMLRNCSGDLQYKRVTISSSYSVVINMQGNNCCLLKNS